MGSPESPSLKARKPGVVIDASILLKLLLPEKQSEAVRRVWGRWVEQDTEIVAPFLLAYEVVSVLRNKVFRKELPPEAGRRRLSRSGARRFCCSTRMVSRKRRGNSPSDGTCRPAMRPRTWPSPKSWIMTSGQRITGLRLHCEGKYLGCMS